MEQKLKITLLADDVKSWIIPYVIKLKTKLQQRGHRVFVCHRQKDIKRGDLAFFLGCGRVVPEELLRHNLHNLVVHPSALPQGKGFAPLFWQIIEGKNNIPVTLFEAVEKVDAGVIYYQDILDFKGHELNAELRRQQGQKTIDLVLRFVDVYPDVPSRAQVGEGTWYRRRTAKDSELDVNKSLAEQFNLLRTVDNKHYPAFFVHRGHSYILKIYRAK